MAKLLFYQNSNRQLEGLMSISSFLKEKGHETDLIVEGSESLEDKLKEFQPDVVGMQVLTKDHDWAVQRAKESKKNYPKIKTLLGGPHPTFYPKIGLEDNVDMICIGEGEKPSLELMNHIDEKRDTQGIESLWYQKNGDLIETPLSKPLKQEEILIPDRDLYKGVEGIRDRENMQVMCSRGCPYKCNFCINYGMSKLFGKVPIRLKEPSKIIEEINNERKSQHVKTIHFQDDIFGMNKKWLGDFSKKYKEGVDLPFYALLRCELINEDLLDTIKDMGCYEVGIGVESGNERIRNEVLGKRLKTSTIENAANLLKKKGLKFHTFNMFGLPEEGLEEAYETLDLNLRLGPDIAYAQIFHPYPGTKFFEEDVVGKDFNLFATNKAYDKNYKKIQKLQKLAMLTVKFPSLRKFVPELVNSSVSNEYFDKLAQEAWEEIYRQRLKNNY